MLKSVLMLALCATIAFAQAYEVHIWNNAGKRVSLTDNAGRRSCICLNNTETAKIYNKVGGDVRLFSSSECIGNYALLAVGKTQTNAHSVNSLSIGKSVFPPSGPLTCPNYFDV
ncbi:MAG: hypothetical protein JOS17DRAFT_752498 [Linnemannia elongata]|nr:MAG: hypothetical protein JOS17DRAFT_752498 [Linnemannia elongata]